jgi:hypothetical protein
MKYKKYEETNKLFLERTIKALPLVLLNEKKHKNESVIISKSKFFLNLNKV